MTEAEVIIYEGQGPKAALHLLKTSKSDHGFLVTRGNKYLGLLTEKRLSDLINKNSKDIKEALEPDIPTSAGDMLLEDLFCLAVATKYPIPVTDENGKLIGEIDNETILSSMVQYKETETEELEIGDTETKEVEAKETETDE
jgi:glycine betaine/proline transport system ATP-binding protein